MRLRTAFMAALPPCLIPLMVLAQPPADDGQWLNVPAQSLAVDPGSPLDFSGLVPPGPAGARGAVTQVGDGLAMGGAAMPTLNCGQVSYGIDWGREYPTHAQSDALAAQFRLHGYSLVRLQNVDYLLMRFGKTDLDVHADQLDRFYYLLAALKRNGIYWMMDVLSSPGKHLMGRGYLDGVSPDDLRIRLNFDPAARAEWLRFVDTVYARPNPYTGRSILADPALAFVIGANEGGIAFAAKPGQPYPTGFAQAFAQWAATPGRDGTAPAARAGGPVALPADWQAGGPGGALLRDFATTIQVDTYRWMQGALAQRGFRGPLLADQTFAHGANNQTRAALPIIDMHDYNGEVWSTKPGAHYVLPSSASNQGLGNWLLPASARWLDRPMVVSEYDQPYPNPYRYESGLFFPWLAAFQGYDTICRNASLSVEPAMPGPGGQPIQSYTIGLDPTERAAETLSAVLFARGDAAVATHVAAVPFGPDQFAQPGSAFLPGTLRRMALLARFGLIAPDRVGTLPRGSLVLPAPGGPGGFGQRLAAGLSAYTGGDQAPLVAALRARRGLSPGNATDPAAGIYQSGNGEMTLDERAGTIRIATRRTEAASATGPVSGLAIGALSIASLDSGALVAATSLDGRDVASSRRLLLILAGDSRNTGLSLGGGGVNRTLIDPGTLPVQMRRVTADLALRTAGRAARLTVLSLRGSPIGGGAVPVVGGVARVHLDTAAASTPTTFFLLELQ